MAGTVANVGLYSNNFRDVGYSRHLMDDVSMEEGEVIKSLKDTSFTKRSEILEYLKRLSRAHGGRLPFQNQRGIFQALSSTLSDTNWDIRKDCIQLINDLIPSFDDNLDQCMWIVLPVLVPILGDNKITIRKAVIQTLHVYMKYTGDMQYFFNQLVKYGVENPDAKVRKEVLVALPMLLTPEFAREDFFIVTQALAKKLLDSSQNEESLQHFATLNLEKIRNLVGEHSFNVYLQKLSPPLKKFCVKLLDTQNNEIDSPRYSRNGSANLPVVSPFSASHSAPTSPYAGRHVGSNAANSAAGSLKFGFVPSHLIEKLNDQEFKQRAQAMEELKYALEEIQDKEVLIPHTLKFISFLNNLLDDSNFKITTSTLDIMRCLVQLLGSDIRAHVHALVSALTKKIGDSIQTVKIAVFRVLEMLSSVLGASEALSVICVNLRNRNSRVRHETLNFVIRSLLKFPSYDFDLAALCDQIAHTLVDQKRQVRHACLECFAVLAQNLGPGKLQPLVHAVDSVELMEDGDGAMAAVQARLARRQLPRLDNDSMVVYAQPLPTSSSGRGVVVPQGADWEWIMAGSGGTGSSARASRAHPMENMKLETMTSSAPPTPIEGAGVSASIPGTPRRLASAGRLPWDAGEPDQENKTPPQQQTSAKKKKESARNSASKKRAQKIFADAQARERDEGSRSPSPVQTPTPPQIKQRNSKLESPFSTAPKLVRKQSDKKFPDASPPPSSNPAHIEQAFQPYGGATFRENRGSDVRVVGKGYAEDAAPADPKPSFTQKRNKNKKLSELWDDYESDDVEAALLSPLGIASSHSHGQDTLEDDQVPNVVGKGVFETSSMTSVSSLGYSSIHGSDRASRERRPSEDSAPPPQGVYGVSMQQSPSAEVAVETDTRTVSTLVDEDYSYDFESADEEEDGSETSDEEISGPSLSNSARIKIEATREAKKREETEKAERVLRRQRERDARIKRESEARLARQQAAVLARTSPDETDSGPGPGIFVAGVNNTSPTKPPLPKAPMKKKKSSSLGTPKALATPPAGAADVSPTLSSSAQPDDLDRLEPPLRPQDALTESLRTLSASEWERRCVNFDLLRSVAYYNPEVVAPRINDVIRHVLAGVGDGRSQVDRYAMACLGDLYRCLGKPMEVDLDRAAKKLLDETGKSSKFLQEDAAAALAKLVDHVTPGRVLLALVGGGGSSKNATIRRSTGKFMLMTLEKLDGAGVFECQKEVSEKTVVTVSKFMQDGDIWVRYYALNMAHLLMTSPQFEPTLHKLCDANTLRNIGDKLDKVRRDGPPDPPEGSSARARRTRDNSLVRGSSAGSEPATPGQRAVPRSRSGDELEAVAAVRQLLNAQEFRQREKGVGELQQLLDQNPDIVNNNIHKIFDCYNKLLRDANSKVQLTAVRAFNDMIPALSPGLPSVLGPLLPALSANLTSKNAALVSCSSDALDSLQTHLDPSILISPMAAQAKTSTATVKADLIQRVGGLVLDLKDHGRSKHSVIKHHAVPLLWTLLDRRKNASAQVGDVRKATADLAVLLHDVFEQELFALGEKDTNVTPAMLQELRGMIDV